MINDTWESICPSGFNVDKDDINIRIEECEIHKYNADDMPYCNIFLDNFKGVIILKECDIYTEDEPVKFIDKLEYLTGKSELIII